MWWKFCDAIWGKGTEGHVCSHSKCEKMLIVPKDAFETEEGGLWIQDSNVYDLKPFFKTQHLQVSTGLCHFSLDVLIENSKPFLIHQKTGIPLDVNTQTHTHT